MSSDSPDRTPSSLDYRAAGVNIDAGAALVERIKPLAAATQRPGVMAGLGGFGALFELPLERYRQPVLVSGTDGVGTKLRLAIELNRHDGIGIDLVAMCANDILVCGAEPLFFLDYYASAQLDVEIATRVVAGIAEGCRQAGCALAGGETAEMPGMYTGDDYDLAGFCVGIAEKEALIRPQHVAVDDVLIALPSSGPHANGYSLIRKVIELTNADLSQPLPGNTTQQTLAEALLAPTRIYVKTLLALTRTLEIHALAHITGGGITENLPRVLPHGVQATIELNSWQRPAVFDWIQTHGAIADTEMLRTFNCGVGMLICVAPTTAAIALAQLEEAGEQPWIIGRIENGQGAPRVVYCQDGRNV